MREVKRVKDVWTKGPTVFEDEQEFHNFFDIDDTVENALKRGFIDFSHRIFTPDFYQVLGDPRDKTALEIGFGGGRLLNAASNFFGNVVGVDIHECFDRTSSILDREGCTNYQLVHRDDIDSIPENSIDFVYSFIVFQHFSHWSEAEFYIKHVERVLKPGGCGILYMAINERDQNADFVESGEFWEELGVSLVVKPDFAMKRLSESFQVFQASRTAKSMWGKGATMQSAQFYMKFLKPEISEGDK
tara:strand:+ start:4270 stop:5004 length:735 start_codon:yes stop_codon:yes gene_type:complete